MDTQTHDLWTVTVRFEVAIQPDVLADLDTMAAALRDQVGWLEAVTHVHFGWQRRREAPAVALYRTGDLEVLLTHPAIDWDEVRAAPRGRPSPLARLSPRPAQVNRQEPVR